jgi:hypothetical protein
LANINRSHREKRSSLLESKKKGFLERKHKIIIIDSDSDQSCTRISTKNKELGVESSNVDCNEHSFTDQNKEMKSLGETALENAIHTGARLTKKIKEFELKIFK